MSAQPVRDGEPPLDMVDSPGKRLRIARQAKGLSHGDVAAHLHLSSETVKALEDDDFERLPGPVFVRGYLRNYARLLGMDDASLMDHLSDDVQHTASAPPKSYGTVKPEIRSSHFAVRLVTWLIVIGLVALLAVWWQGHLDWNGGVNGDHADLPAESDAETTDDAMMTDIGTTSGQADLRLPAPVPPPQEEAEEPAPLEAASTENTVTEPAEPTDTLVTEPDNASPNDASATATDVTEPEVTETAAEPAGVMFEFLGPCWVDIRDSTRKFKVFGEMRKGEIRKLEGTPPYSVILGNSPMVRITVDGKPFDLESHARGSVARFTLDPDAQSGAAD